MNDIIILKEDLTINSFQYKKGDMFTIIGMDSHRGWDIKHNKTGNMIYECRFIQHSFEYYDIKEERKDKLNQINGNTTTL